MAKSDEDALQALRDAAQEKRELLAEMRYHQAAEREAAQRDTDKALLEAENERLDAEIVAFHSVLEHEANALDTAKMTEQAVERDVEHQKELTKSVMSTAERRALAKAEREAAKESTDTGASTPNPDETADKNGAQN